MKIRFKNNSGIKASKLVHAIGKDELRPAMKHVFINLVKQEVVVTNANILFISPIEIQTDSVKTKDSVMIPLMYFNEKKYATESKFALSDLDYVLDDDFAKVYLFGKLVFQCEYYDQMSYPDYNSAILNDERSQNIETIGFKKMVLENALKLLENDDALKITFLEKTK